MCFSGHIVGVIHLGDGVLLTYLFICGVSVISFSCQQWCSLNLLQSGGGMTVTQARYRQT